MKVTGIVLIALGLIAGAVVVVQMVQPGPPNADTPGVADARDRPDMTVPLAACGAAIVIGGLLVMFGRRSYFVNNDPRVRN